MLNLSIAMLLHHNFSRFSTGLALVAALILLFSGSIGAASAQQKPQVIIDSPRSGDALQGVVSIVGTTEVEGFRSVEIAFAYQSDPTGTWFLIAQSGTAVKAGALASWDTTTISDGSYRLRVRVLLNDGQALETVVDGLRVRNYLPIETPTPGARAGQMTPTPTATLLPDFEIAAVNPTPLPTNPAVVTRLDLQNSAAQGALAAAGLLAAFGLYLALRAVARR
jgi:hypothetical protein